MEFRDFDIYYVVDSMRVHGAQVKTISAAIGVEETELKAFIRAYDISINWMAVYFDILRRNHNGELPVLKEEAIQTATGRRKYNNIFWKEATNRGILVEMADMIKAALHDPDVSLTNAFCLDTYEKH